MPSMSFLATLSLSFVSSLTAAKSTGMDLPIDIIAANTTNLDTCTMATVSFYSTENCAGTATQTITAGKGFTSTNVAQFSPAPISMMVNSCANYGFALTLTQDKIDDNLPCVEKAGCCAYCGDYYSAGQGYATGGSTCININTGFGPDSALLAYEGSNGAGQTPCENYQNECNFPVPPGNGMIKQDS